MIEAERSRGQASDLLCHLPVAACLTGCCKIMLVECCVAVTHCQGPLGAGWLPEQRGDPLGSQCRWGYWMPREPEVWKCRVVPAEGSTIECPDGRALEASSKKWHLKLSSKDASDEIDGLLSKSALDWLGPGLRAEPCRALTELCCRPPRGVEAPWRRLLPDPPAGRKGCVSLFHGPATPTQCWWSKSERNNKCVLTLQAAEPCG